MLSEVVQAALAAASMGYAVFPTEGKHPALGIKWKEQSATDADSVLYLFGPEPSFFGVGIKVPRGAFIFDLDIKPGCDGAANLRELRPGYDPLDHAGPLARTGGGGLHLWFRLPTGVSHGNSPGRLPAGCDVRSNGRGYVIVPPSVHPVTGRRYEWIRPLVPVSSLPLIPLWLLGLILPTPRPVQHPRRTATNSDRTVPMLAALLAVRTAPEGCRNATLNRIAFAMAGAVAPRGGDLGELRATLEKAALDAGLPLWEVKKTLDSAIAAGSARPFQGEQL